MSDTFIRNAWTSRLPIEVVRQKIDFFVEEKQMVVESSENDCYQVRHDILPAGENAAEVISFDFPTRATIRLKPEAGGTYIDAEIQETTLLSDEQPEAKSLRELELKKWMWTLYNLLPANQPALQPLPPSPHQPSGVQPPPQRFAPQPGPNPPYYPPGYYQPKPPKDRGLTMILEIVAALFGIYGIGWIYAGNTSAGVGWLVGVLVWDLIAVLIAIFTGGIGLFCTVPVSILLIVLSATSLNTYIKNHPEIFGT